MRILLTTWNVYLVSLWNTATWRPLVWLDNYVRLCAVEEDFKGCYNSEGKSEMRPSRRGVSCRKKKSNAPRGDEITEPWRSERSLPATCPRRASSKRNFVLEQVKTLPPPPAHIGTANVLGQRVSQNVNFIFWPKH